MQIPGRKIFILAAVCLSVVVIAIVIKKKIEKNDIIRTNLGIASSSPADSISGGILDLISRSEIEGALATTTNPFDPEESDTLTDSLSKQLFVSYLQSDSAGLLDTQEGADQIAEKVISNIDTSQLPQTAYTFEQLTTFSPKINKDLYDYGNAYATAEIGNLMVIKERPSDYEDDLEAIAGIYKKISEDLMKIKTPLVLAANHLAIANSYAMMSESLININNSPKDPLKATLSIKIFKEALSAQSNNYLEIASFLQDNAIIFPENSMGRIFNPK